MAQAAPDRGYDSVDVIPDERWIDLVRDYSGHFLHNTATWAIWNSLDLVVTLTMAFYLPSGNAFAGVATAITITTLLALSLSFGMTSAMESIIPAEFGRCEKSPKITRCLRVAILTNVLLFAPIALLFVFCPLSLLQWAFPQGNAEMLLSMQTWLRWSPLLVTPQLICTCFQRFAVSQRRSGVVSKSAAMSLVLLPVVLFFAARTGSVLAFVMALAVDKWALTAQVIFHILQEETLAANFWGPPETEPCDYWSELCLYLKTGYPSLVAYCLDIWVFELMTVVAARCGPSEVAAWALLMQLTNPVFALANGSSTTGATEVGNATGSGSLQKVRRRVNLVVFFSIGLGVFSAVIIAGVGPVLFPYLVHSSPRDQGSHFSSKKVVEIGTHALPLYALHTLMDLPFYSLQGVFRGLQLQSLAARFVFFSLWVFTVPFVLSKGSLGTWIPQVKGIDCVNWIILSIMCGSGLGAFLLYRALHRHLRKGILTVSTEDGDVTM